MDGLNLGGLDCHCFLSDQGFQNITFQGWFIHLGVCLGTCTVTYELIFWDAVHMHGYVLGAMNWVAK